jgi:hypothetical protein
MILRPEMILEFLLAHATDSPQLQDLVVEYGADKSRMPVGGN